jgi:hypothetical protein
VGANAILYTGVPLPIDGSQTIQARAWDGAEWSARIQAAFVIALPGDLNHDGQLNDADIDALCQQVLRGQFDAAFDFNHDQLVNTLDQQLLVEQLLGTSAGDANLDGVFNSTDLILVFGAGSYEDSADDNSGWAGGDWNCDGDFDSGDLIAAFAAGRYDPGAKRPVAPTPMATIASAADAIFHEWAGGPGYRIVRHRRSV